MLSYGWPLSADDWDTQMLFFLGESRVAKAVLISAVPPLMLSPGTIGDVARAALVLVQFGHQMIN